MSTDGFLVDVGVASASPYVFDLFVINAVEDAAFVHNYLLPSLGLSRSRVLSIDEMRLGEPIVSEIERGLSCSRFAVIVLSQAWLADRFAMFGGQLASYLSIDGGRVIPLRLTDCDLPLHLKARVSLDFTKPALWQLEVARLRTLLRPDTRQSAQAAAAAAMETAITKLRAAPIAPWHQRQRPLAQGAVNGAPGMVTMARVPAAAAARTASARRSKVLQARRRRAALALYAMFVAFAAVASSVVIGYSSPMITFHSPTLRVSARPETPTLRERWSRALVAPIETVPSTTDKSRQEVPPPAR